MKRFLLLIALLLAPSGAYGAFALVAHDCVPVVAGTATTASLDTSGADLLVGAYVMYQAGTITSITDTKSNDWTTGALTAKTNSGNTIQIRYVVNPTVGAGHQLIMAATSGFQSLCLYAFSGANTSAPFDQQNGLATEDVSSQQPGSVTPTTDNQLIFTGTAIPTDVTMSIDGGFTEPANGEEAFGSGVNYGLATAYLIQTTATAANPTWTPSTAPVPMASVIATFKAAAGGGGGVPVRHRVTQQ